MFLPLNLHPQVVARGYRRGTCTPANTSYRNTALASCSSKQNLRGSRALAALARRWLPWPREKPTRHADPPGCPTIDQVCTDAEDQRFFFIRRPIRLAQALGSQSERAETQHAKFAPSTGTRVRYRPRRATKSLLPPESLFGRRAPKSLWPTVFPSCTTYLNLLLPFFWAPPFGLMVPSSRFDVI